MFECFAVRRQKAHEKTLSALFEQKDCKTHFSRVTWMSADDEYKRAKEAFVSGLQGTTAREVFAVFALMPVSSPRVSSHWRSG